MSRARGAGQKPACEGDRFWFVCAISARFVATWRENIYGQAACKVLIFQGMLVVSVGCWHAYCLVRWGGSGRARF